MTPEQVEHAAHLVRTQLRERNSVRLNAVNPKQQNTSPTKNLNSKNGPI